ncbi:hypothetical protein M501DRAFT_905818, partial [Patellaria atrata CBS 101060]
DSSEEEDYMSMTLLEPTQNTHETSLQRLSRQKREAEARSRPKSKSQLHAEQTASRESALSTSLDSTNKGFQLLSKLGYKAGSTLGKSSDARMEPIRLEMKEGRSGVGLDSQRKRKMREEFEEEGMRKKVEVGDFRERLAGQRAEKRMEGQFFGAQKIAEQFDAEGEEDGAEDGEEGGRDVTGDARVKKVARPLKNINILWRGLIRHRLEKEKEARARHDFQLTSTNAPTYEDSDDDEDDKHAIGADSKWAAVEEEVQDEDPELEEFEALPISERLDKVVNHLRQIHNYCFWCKHKYPDSTMDGCPGTTEDDHD